MYNKHHFEDPYKVLEIERGSSEAEVKTAYFTKVRQHSPEKDPIGFKRIRAAYEKLRNQEDKSQTDLLLLDEFDSNLPDLKFPDINQPESSIKKDIIAIEAHLLLRNSF